MTDLVILGFEPTNYVNYYKIFLLTLTMTDLMSLLMKLSQIII